MTPRPIAVALLAVLATSACAGKTTVRTVTVTKTISPTPAAIDSGAGPVLQPESCKRVAQGADGNPGPIVCPDGHPNAYAMTILQGTAPRMIALGEFATTQDIQDAACADLPHSTNPIEQSAYEWVKALNGWAFGADPTDGGLFSYCTSG